MAKIKIKDIEMLDREVERLKRRSRRLEEELGARADHLRDNYRSMAMNAVVPGIANSGFLGVVGGLATTLFKSGAGKSMLNSVLIGALEFIGVKLGIKLVDKIRNRRHRRKRNSANPEADGE
ncbi:hypothetical protein [Chitinophaga rhizosphaerae]|uniref:hypothetical protein n=1 Tax=Chitinophaga rhizosphaerae TaxID=1864947 RepID=UPI000F80CFA8|nr:hypothetical protein [Chitinophaga rhizosphaerae]